MLGQAANQMPAPPRQTAWLAASPRLAPGGFYATACRKRTHKSPVAQARGMMPAITHDAGPSRQSNAGAATSNGVARGIPPARAGGLLCDGLPSPKHACSVARAILALGDILHDGLQSSLVVDPTPATTACPDSACRGCICSQRPSRPRLELLADSGRLIRRGRDDDMHVLGATGDCEQLPLAVLTVSRDRRNDQLALRQPERDRGAGESMARGDR
jgi:hypothetical protein